MLPSGDHNGSLLAILSLFPRPELQTGNGMAPGSSRTIVDQDQIRTRWRNHYRTRSRVRHSTQSIVTTEVVL
jgi:hypothetical protein